jgi:rubredoxin
MLSSDPLAGTFAGLYIDGYSITVHCSPCQKQVEIDLLKMPLLNQYVGRKFRCQTCGQIGQGIVGAPYTGLARGTHREAIDAERNERRLEIENLQQN